MATTTVPPSDPRPRVLLFTTLDGYGWGGSEKYWYDAVHSRAVYQGLDIRIVLPRSPMAEERARSLIQLGHTVLWRDPIELSFPRRIGRALLGQAGVDVVEPVHRRWMDWLRTQRPDLIIFAMASTLTYGALLGPALLARERGVPYWIIVQHAPEHFFPKDDSEVARFRTLFQGARRVVFISERNRSAVERMMATDLSNAWMGTNSLSGEFLERARKLVPALTQSSPPVEPKLLNLARFEPDIKGQHLLFQVLASPEWQARDWQLMLAGGGRHADTLGRLLRHFGLVGRVRLLDHTDDVLNVIAQADISVMPSLSEGTPFALLEAMAAGRPAVVTPVGGMSEVVEDGRTGWLATAPDVAPISDALNRAWQARREWAVFGRRAAQAVARSHNADETVPRLAAVLREDISEVSRRPLSGEPGPA
jgi:glycosyltransferase involved in cell wall biosynthesis